MRAPFFAAILTWVLVSQAGAREAIPRGDGAIEGQVTDAATGEGLADERVVLWWRPPKTSREYPYPWEPAVGSGQLHRVTDVRTDEQGTFLFEDLAGGRYRLRIDLPTPGDDLDIDVPDGQTAQRPIAVDLGRSVRVQVARPDGSPVAGADVFVTGLEDDEGGNARPVEHARGRRTRPDGRVRLAALPAGAVWIQARQAEHGFSPAVRIAAGDKGGEVRLQLRDEIANLHPLDQPFAGVGISVGRTSLGPVVAAVDPERPAGAAGLQEGDVIVAVDGFPTVWMTFDEFLMRCRGRAGEPVRLTLERGGQRDEVALVREAF